MVIVDSNLNPAGSEFEILYSNKNAAVKPGTAVMVGRGEIHEVDGGMTAGPCVGLPVNLRGMEVQVLGRGIG
jgi:hypothetical protein